MEFLKSNDAGTSFPEFWPQPLQPPELEVFARKFHETFDGVAAAREAGYDDPDQIWPELIATDHVKSRLRYFQANGGVEDRDPVVVFNQMFEQAFASLDNMVITDVITGELRIDWNGAAKQMPVLFDVDETIVNNGGIPQKTTRMRKHASAAMLRALIQDSEKVEARAKSNNGLFSRESLFGHYLKGFQQVPVVPDDPVRRMARANRSVPFVPVEEEEVEP